MLFVNKLILNDVSTGAYYGGFYLGADVVLPEHRQQGRSIETHYRRRIERDPLPIVE